VTDLAVPPRFLEDVYQAASECNKCSLCQAVCPTYVTTPVEWETARGRVSLVGLGERVGVGDLVVDRDRLTIGGAAVAVIIGDAN